MELKDEGVEGGEGGGEVKGVRGAAGVMERVSQVMER